MSGDVWIQCLVTYGSASLYPLSIDSYLGLEEAVGRGCLIGSRRPFLNPRLRTTAVTSLPTRATQVDERSEERLSALLNLYNVTSAVEVQLPVLLATSEYSRK